jgi:hypothetical protein
MYHVNIYRYPKSAKEEWVLLVKKDANKVISADLMISGEYTEENDVACSLIRGADEATVNGDNTLYAYDKNGFKVHYANYLERLHPVSELVTLKNYKEIIKRGDEKINELLKQWESQQKNLEKKLEQDKSQLPKTEG